MRYTVDSAEIALAAARARSTGTAIHTEVGAMMSHLIALQSTWTGSAAIAFEELARRWQAVQAQVEANLEQISLALDSAATTYAETEAATARLFAG